MSYRDKIASCLGLPVLCLILVSVPHVETSCAALPEGADPEKTIVIPLDENNTIFLEPLIDFAAQALGISINYDREEVDTVEYHFTSVVEVPESEFQGYFERLLLKKDFLFVESGTGETTFYSVIHTQKSRHIALQIISKFVHESEIEAYADRGILISTYIPLKNLQARDLMQTLSGAFTSGPNIGESARFMENMNAIVITSFGFKTYEIVRFIKSMDAAAAGSEVRIGFSREIKDLKRRVSNLEKQLPSPGNK